MLAVALRRRGAVWLAQLAPAASPTLHIGGGNRQRALCTAAQAAASQSAAADVTTDADFAEPAGKRKGRPPKKGPLLLLVESPAKARKIQEFLGPQYTVLASYGHIRDLPAKQGSVQPDDGFAMKWSVLDNAEGRLAPIVGAARTASRILLATDPDREGEAISWHLLQELQARKAIRKVTPTERITFTEVTKRAVEEALLHPRSISEPLVHAYMARRALDYLFGFHLSPLLWRKVPGAQSAGRVQSVALRLVCEREAAIAAFQQHMYYTVEAALQLPGDLAAMARVVSVDGQPPPQPGFTERKVADDVAARVAAAQFNVLEASTREQQRQPPAPFTTSTLQQEANKRLGLGASRTMQLAQRLYEAGHITYMRTDGVSLDPEAATELRQVAVAEHGAEYVPQQPRVFKSKAKNAQEAHEAIRPTSAQLTVEGLAALGAEPAATKLYGLIRGRALACQMSPARITQVAADLADENGSLRLRATASAIAFPGYLAALSDPSSSFAAGVAAEEEDAKQGGAPAEGTEEGDVGDGSAGGSPDVWLAQQEAARALAAALATFQRGQAVALCNAAVALHETRPPARFTEGSLVKQLEELGIGRPGTYAPTITVLQARGYMLKQGRALHAKALGQVLSAFLQTYFPTYVDYGFTSGLEVQLDEVAGGGASWKDVVGGFWTPFSAALGEVADVAVTDVINRLNDAVGDQLIGEDRVCPSCGGQLSFKFASRKLAAPFVGCSTYPTCKYVRNLDESWEVHDAMGALQQEGGSNPAPGTELVSHAITAIQAERAAAIAGLSGYARLLGDCPDTGLPVFVRAGLYGPYVQRGLHAEHETHFRRQALARNAAHRVVTLQMALAMLSLPKDLGVNPATGDNVLVAMGKFGAFIRCGALSRAIPKDYDPLTMTLADALQLLASKANYATARTTRKAALADAAAAESAVEAAEQTEKAAAARVVARKQKKKRVGRPSKVDIAIERAATAAAERLQASQGQAALGSHQRLEEEADLAALRLHQARTAARVALDAAAEVQVEQLQAALAMGDDVADEAERVLAAADKKRSRQKLGVNAYNLYHREVVEEAARSGDKWWGQEHAAVAIAERWKGLSAQEQQRFEAQAQEARLELDAHAAGLLAPDTPLSSLTAAQRAQLDADLAMRQLEALEGSTGAKRLKKKLLLPRPRTAYNLFTTSRQQLAKDDLGPGATGSDIMLRLAEMWRSSTVFQKAEYKGQADEEAKAYREAKTALTQQQQAATAAALAEGMDPMAAARAGLLAGQALVEEFMRQRERRARKMAAAKAVREGEAE